MTDKFNGDGNKIGDLGNPSAFFGGTFAVMDNSNWDWASPVEIPDGRLAVANPFPTGPNGAVSLTNALRANFAFADGHVKSMVPAATNPSPILQPDKDMWDSLR